MFRTTFAALMLAVLGSTAMADPVEGIWQTEPDDGNFAHIQIAPCGGAFCGTIIRTFNAEGEYQSENIGRVLAIDMVAQGDGSYDGSVWRPSNDKIYIGDMTLNGDALRLRGCVAGGLLCSGQDWVRVQ